MPWLLGALGGGGTAAGGATAAGATGATGATLAAPTIAGGSLASTIPAYAAGTTATAPWLAGLENFGGGLGRGLVGQGPAQFGFNAGTAGNVLGQQLMAPPPGQAQSGPNMQDLMAMIQALRGSRVSAPSSLPGGK